MPYVDKHDQRRTRAIAQKLDAKGQSASQIASTLDVTVRTVRRWRNEHFRDEQPRGRPVEFVQEDVAPLIREFLRENMNATLEEVRD
jgi:transposase